MAKTPPAETGGGTGTERRPGSRRRRFVVAAVLVLLALNVLAAGGVLWLRTSVPTVAGTVEGLAGLAKPASVTRDSRGVLYITAESPEDASFALGFAHAQDRLWQMEMTRRIGSGRLAEVVGEAGLPVDRMLRTLGLYRLAEANLDRLSPAARAHVEAYAAGVNGYLDTRSGALPPEFVLLGHSPERWRPADSLVWGRLMSLQLAGNWFGEILRARMLKAGLTRADLDTLWAERPQPPRAGADASSPAVGSGTALSLLDAGRLDRIAAALPDVLAPRLASNVWILDGSRTPTGKPVLAGDPHLGFTDPGLWSLARIETPGYRRVGAFVPGVPFLLLGHNGRVAWSMTTTTSDTQDLFVEKLDPADPGRYLTPDGSAAFATRTETLRAGDRTLELTVRATRHGPVVSDVMESAADAAAAGTVLALASPVLMADDDTAEALFRMGEATDADSFVAALRGFHAPQQNVAFADVDGRLGIVSAGRVPVRVGDGFLPSQGWTGTQDWRGWLPFEALPKLRDPASGAIVNANNRVWPSEQDRFFGREPDAPYRADRIAERLADADGSVEAMAALQRDTRSGYARDLVPVLLPLVAGRAPDKATRAALTLLRLWDGDMAAGRPEPVIFAAWTAALHERLLADDLGGLLRGYQRIRAATLLRILLHEPGWCDDRRTATIENCADIVAGSLSEAMAAMTRRFGEDVAKWRWGDAHQAVFEHRIWSRLPVIGGFLQRRAVTGGGDYTVSRGSWTWGDGERPVFPHNHGASYRAVYDLADLERSRFAAALGASGNLFSPYFGSWQGDWTAGRSFAIPVDPDDDTARLSLRP
ncbi:MAG: penicillin acylase family protein [Thalassobaculum sp.]|uniref:penicillin acylase family protein n=1 Tax=Thalassobaculum sp. TaxID=2022740 RepID=UPI0032EE713B